MPQWKQYSGIWTPTQQAQAVADGTWTGIIYNYLYTGGNSSSGDLGDNTTINKSSPVQIGTDTWLFAHSVNGDMVIAQRTDGSIWSWGENGHGQLGVGDKIKYSSPVQIGALTNWSKIRAADWNAGALKNDGTLWLWGRGSAGQLGNNNAISRSSPVQVGADTDWDDFVTSDSLCLAKKTDGSLWVWGTNYFGSCGLDSALNYVSSPTQIGIGSTWTQITTGKTTAGAIKDDGTAWVWGRNNYGQLGLNNKNDVSSPTQIGSSDYTQINVGSVSQFLKSDGTLWVSGINNQGQLGLNIGIAAHRSSPVQLGALSTWALNSVKSGNANATLFIKQDSSIYGTGYNFYGSLLQEDTVNRSSPVQIGPDKTWSSAYLGFNGSLFVGISEEST